MVEAITTEASLNQGKAGSGRLGWAHTEGWILQCQGTAGFRHTLWGISEIDTIKGKV